MPNLFKLFLYLFLSFYQFKTIAAASCDLGPIANCASSSVESISLGTSLSGAKCVENCQYCIDVSGSENICKLCEYGYFMFTSDANTNQCIQCPDYEQLIATTPIIKCYECVIFPQSFQLSYICKTQLQTFTASTGNPMSMQTESSKTYHLNNSFNKVYKITTIKSGQFQLIICENCQYYCSEFEAMNDFFCGYDPLETKKQFQYVKCAEGYFFLAGSKGTSSKCSQCGNSCSQCLSETICIKCNASASLDNSKCTSIGNCAKIQTNKYQNIVFTSCAQCSEGYQIDYSANANSCYKCSTKINNCGFCYQTWQDSTKKLIKSYFPKFQIIQQKTVPVLCAMCLPGYTLNSSENGCSISTKKVPTNCETMMDSSGAYLKCLQCNASYALDTLKANSNSACAASCSAQEANCLICYIVDTVQFCAKPKEYYYYKQIALSIKLAECETKSQSISTKYLCKPIAVAANYEFNPTMYLAITNTKYSAFFQLLENSAISLSFSKTSYQYSTVSKTAQVPFISNNQILYYQAPLQCATSNSMFMTEKKEQITVNGQPVDYISYFYECQTSCESWCLVCSNKICLIPEAKNLKYFNSDAQIINTDCPINCKLSYLLLNENLQSSNSPKAACSADIKCTATFTLIRLSQQGILTTSDLEISSTNYGENSVNYLEIFSKELQLQSHQTLIQTLVISGNFQSVNITNMNLVQQLQTPYSKNFLKISTQSFQFLNYLIIKNCIISQSWTESSEAIFAENFIAFKLDEISFYQSESVTINSNSLNIYSKYSSAIILDINKFKYPQTLQFENSVINLQGNYKFLYIHVRTQSFASQTLVNFQLFSIPNNSFRIFIIQIDNLIFDNVISNPNYNTKNILVTANYQATLYIRKLSLNNFQTSQSIDTTISNNFKSDLYRTIIIQHAKIIVEEILFENSENIGFVSLIQLPSDFSESNNYYIIIGENESNQYTAGLLLNKLQISSSLIQLSYTFQKQFKLVIQNILITNCINGLHSKQATSAIYIPNSIFNLSNIQTVTINNINMQNSYQFMLLNITQVNILTLNQILQIDNRENDQLGTLFIKNKVPFQQLNFGSVLSSNTIKLTNSYFFQNSFTYLGSTQKSGHLLIYTNNIIIENCYFHNSENIQNSGIKIQGLSSAVTITISNAVFYMNVAFNQSKYLSNGGALYINANNENINLIIENSLFQSNSALNSGGCIYMDYSGKDSSYTILNSNFFNCFSYTKNIIAVNIVNNPQVTLTLNNLQIQFEFNVLTQFFFQYLNPFLSYFEEAQENRRDIFSFVSIDVISITNIQFKNVYYYNGIYVTLFKSLKINQVGFDSGQVNNNFFIFIQNVTSSSVCFINGISISKFQGLNDYQLEATLNSGPYASLTSYNKNPYYNLFTLNILTTNGKISFSDVSISAIFSKIFSKPKIAQIGLMYFQNMIINPSGLRIAYVTIADKFNNLPLMFSYQSTLVINNIIVIGCQSLNATIIIADSTLPNPGLSLTILKAVFQNNVVHSLSVLTISRIYQVLLTAQVFYQNSAISYHNNNNIVGVSGGVMFSDYLAYDPSYDNGNKWYQIRIENSMFHENFGSYAGGVFSPNIYYSSQQLTFEKNSGLFNDDFYVQPELLQIIFNNQIYIHHIISPLVINNQYIQSGQTITNFFIQYLDKQKRVLNGSIFTYGPVSTDQLTFKPIISLQNAFTSLSDSEYYNFNDQSNNSLFNCSNIIFYQEYSILNVYTLQLTFSNVQENYFKKKTRISLLNSIIMQPIIIQFNMENCVSGQYHDNLSSVCTNCAQSFYSLNINQNCQKCLTPQMTNCAGGKNISIAPQYWRFSIYSDEIIYCFNMPTNCLGGQKNFTCFNGTTGPLCESCDYYGLNWFKTFISTGYKTCGECIQSTTLLLQLFGGILFTLLSTFFCLKDIIVTTELAITKKTLLVLKWLPLHLMKDHDNSFGVVIKTLINYAQIMAFITEFRIATPTQLKNLLTTFQNPTMAAVYQSDCLLIQFITSVNIIYTRLLSQMIMPYLFFVFFFSLFGLFQKLKGASVSIYNVKTVAIYLYLASQSSIVFNLMGIISIRTISKVMYISSELQYKFLTSTHTLFMLVIALPILLKLVVLIPVVLYKQLQKNADKLNRFSILMSFGYLYKEYTKNCYYWEIIKIYQKTLLNFFVIFYTDYIIVKGAIIVIILYVYYCLSANKKPFEDSALNQLDKEQSAICLISILLALSLYSNDMFYYFMIIYLLLGALNSYYILKLLQLLVKEQLSGLQILMKDKFQQLVNKFPKIAPMVHLRDDMRMNYLMGRLKSYGRSIMTGRKDGKNNFYGRSSEMDLNDRNSKLSSQEKVMEVINLDNESSPLKQNMK